ncbi:TPR repeat-containing protein YrrB [Anaerohalosphaera lusitana]|uniref:TPR repeat-containing protein YrrB n=1 Tax=Anaerohalosphaera lusitana TaxID=1936003 RepID=A0A1U9NG27_9BACT|nr:tetratricopeptide repeat-containing sulfotransferase family protein [Anaerohalosphaera lusitana]AQT66883.1 TPR repeat-containing protein YrrB [Anaerohalosphaera lusitana]
MNSNAGKPELKGRKRSAQRKATAKNGGFDCRAELLKGLNLFNQGKLPEAEACYKKVLSADPQNHEAYNLLGLLAERCGRQDLAVQFFNKAIQLAPQVAGYYLNMGNLMHRLGKLDEALACHTNALKLDPKNAEAHNNRGIVLYDQQKYDEARQCYAAALALNPKHPQALNNMGNTLRQSGELDEAVEYYEKALALQPRYADAYNNLGTIHYKQMRYDQALDCYDKALELNPNNPEIYNNLGTFLQDQDKLDEALENCKKSLAINPNYPEAYVSLSKIFHLQGKQDDSIAAAEKSVALGQHKACCHAQLGKMLYLKDELDRAIERYEKCIELEPDAAQYHVAMGNIMRAKGLPQRALACYQSACELNDQHGGAAAAIGAVYLEQGDKDKAITQFEKAITIDPLCTEAYDSLASIKKFDKDDELFTSLEQLAADVLPANKKMSIHFALGKMYQGVEEYDRAFENYLEANSLRKKQKGQEFSIKEFKFQVDMFTKHFDRNYFETRKQWGLDTEMPVFIVGMPRSGTSLTEQIISSHPQAFGAGELIDIKMIRPALLNRCNAKSVEQFLQNLKPDDIDWAANKYLSRIMDLSGGEAPRVIDKMPQNFSNLWLIAMMFPNAKIINTRRNPADTCVSIFTLDFVKGHGYKNDLRTLGTYYHYYDKLMQHWKKVLPVPIMEVHYEQLVADQERISRDIIDFCNLEWDDRCLEFHKTKRRVMTASAGQVRKKMYSTSVERWRRYEKHLTPLLEAIENGS